jgi:prothymosin alpha
MVKAAAPAKKASKAAPKVVELAKSAVLDLLKQLGFKNPEKWTDDRLAKKLQELDGVVDDDTAEEKELDKGQRKVLEAVLGACESKAPITLTEDAKPGKKTAAAADPDEETEVEEEEDGDADPDEEDEGGSEDDEEEEAEEEEEAPAPTGKKGAKPAPPAPAKTGKKAAPPVRATGRGAVKGTKKVGIVQCIIDEFSKGTPDKPVTKKEVHDVLVAKFGPGTEANKDPKGMKNTVNASTSWMKTEKNLDVQTNGEGGFWIKKAKGAKK